MIEPKQSYKNVDYFKNYILTDDQYEEISKIQKMYGKLFNKGHLVLKTSYGYIRVSKWNFDRLCHEAETSRSKEGGDINACIFKIVRHRKNIEAIEGIFIVKALPSTESESIGSSKL